MYWGETSLTLARVKTPLQICKNMTGYNLNLDLVNINSFTKSSNILSNKESMSSYNIKRKQKSDIN